MKKKLIALFILTNLLAVSCSFFDAKNKKQINGNIDTFLSQKDNYFKEPNIDEISANLEYSIAFCIYFTDEGCSSCEEFKAIGETFLKTSNFLTYKIDTNLNREEVKKLTNKYGEKYFSKDQNGSYLISTPSYLFIDENGNGYSPSYNSYMKTYDAFSNHINSKYCLSNTYYTSGNVLENQFIDCEFSYVYFDFTKSELLNIYKTKILSYAKEASRKVVVSNYASDDKIHLSISGRKEGNLYSNYSCEFNNLIDDSKLNLIFK